MLVATWREAGLAGCARKLRAAVWMGLPVLVADRRTAQSVGAYFDLITDDGRLFYGDSFHLGYFPRGRREPGRGARRPDRPGGRPGASSAGAARAGRGLRRRRAGAAHRP